MAVGISGDSAAGTVQVKAVLGAAYVFVLESPLAHGGLFLRRHELWRAYGSASAVGQCDAKQPISYKLLMSLINWQQCQETNAHTDNMMNLRLC